MHRIGIAAWLVLAAPAWAGSISLEWDPVTHPGLSGYRISWGQAPGNYSYHIDLGTQPNVTLFGLATCSNYHLAVRARTSDGLLSTTFSNEVSGWTRPEPLDVVPATVPRDTVVTLTVQGDSFMPGAQVLFSDPAIRVLATRVATCNRLAVDVSIGAGAALGPTAFEVVNPDGVYGYASALLEIEENTLDGLPTIENVAVTSVGDTAATVVWTTDEPGNGTVFLRESGMLDYVVWTASAAQVTDHIVDLFGLKPDTLYEYHVRSENAAGEGVTSAPDGTFHTLPNGFDYVRFEAEAGSPVAPFVVVDSGNAFGGKLIVANGTNDVHDLEFLAPNGGSWQVWLRLLASAPQSDGWRVGIDGSLPVEVHNEALGVWEWQPAGSWALGTGLHAIELSGFAAGARLDRVLLTDDPAFRPSERPTGNTVPPGPVTALSGEPGNGRVTLTWISPNVGDLRRIVLRYRTDGRVPETPADGYPAADLAAAPGVTQSVTHYGVPNDTALSYSVFAIDVAGNASVPASVEVTATVGEPLDQVEGVVRTDTR